MIDLISINSRIGSVLRRTAVIMFVICGLLFCASIASASNIIAVQSTNIKPYNDALKGFESACNCSVERFVVSGMKDLDIVKEVRGSRPDLILAIGREALVTVAGIKNIPIVYMMVLDPQPVIAGHNNIAGINMVIVPEKQLSIIHKALPDVKNVGLLFGPLRTGDFVNKARTAAAEKGIKLIENEINNPKDVPASLNNMAGKIDAFWMLPDAGVYTPETIEVLFIYSMKNRVPVITFSSKYLEMGALMSLEVDTYDTGVQAAEISARILSGTDAGQIPDGNVRKINITINERTANKLGINVTSEILNKAKVINRD